MTTLFMRNGLFGRRKFRQGVISPVGSVKIKLLLSCCIIFTLLALASWASSFMGWKQYHTAYLGRSFLPRLALITKDYLISLSFALITISGFYLLSSAHCCSANNWYILHGSFFYNGFPSISVIYRL